MSNHSAAPKILGILGSPLASTSSSSAPRGVCGRARGSVIEATLEHIYINIARDWIGDTHTTYTLSTDNFHKVIRICNTASPCGQPIVVKVGSILIIYSAAEAQCYQCQVLFWSGMCLRRSCPPVSSLQPPLIVVSISRHSLLNLFNNVLFNDSRPY